MVANANDARTRVKRLSMFSPSSTTPIFRRQFLRNAAAGMFGLNWAGLLRAQAASFGAEPSGNAPFRVCIVVFQYGDPSHLDTFDMKPNASDEIRGEFKPISTSVPGLAVCEHLPHMSRVMHKVALIRRMHHANRVHDSASTEVLTGYPPLGGDRENFSPVPQFYPSFGSTINHLRQNRQLDVVNAALPFVLHNVVDVPCQGDGFLGNDLIRFTSASIQNSGRTMPKHLNRLAN